MHTDDPYTIVSPRGCLVATPEGVQDGLVIGVQGSRQLVVHRGPGRTVVSWTPSAEVRLLGSSDVALGSAAVASNT